MKKFLYFLGITGFLFFIFLSPIKAEDKTVELKFYYGIGCPHCALEKEFLKKIETKYQDKVTVSEYEIYYNQENAQIFSDLVKELNIEVAGVPLLI
ncbi:MAG: hypothetical protein PHH12_02570 [Candidatus Shapirobacteria bacterium]|nr:hypothetical protein [Candidatus Shapirobacteria bacterium]